MKLKIAVLEGDGIGPEIMKQGVAVLDAVAEKFGHEFTYTPAICGAHAIEEVGDPYPDATHEVCMQADAVLFAAVGDLKYDNNPTLKVNYSISGKEFNRRVDYVLNNLKSVTPIKPVMFSKKEDLDKAKNPL